MFKFDFADVKPSIPSLVMVTLMAIIGISLAKWAANRFPVPGLTELVNAV